MTEAEPWIRTPMPKTSDLLPCLKWFSWTQFQIHQIISSAVNDCLVLIKLQNIIQLNTFLWLHQDSKYPKQLKAYRYPRPEERQCMNTWTTWAITIYRHGVLYLRQKELCNVCNVKLYNSSLSGHSGIGQNCGHNGNYQGVTKKSASSGELGHHKQS